MTDIERVYSRYVEQRFPLPTEADVEALETRIGVALPPEYRRFLLEYNGGWFRDHDLELPEGVPQDHLECLYGIGANHESAELGQPSDMALFDDNDPPQIVIIGYTSFNFLIILGVHPETYGAVFLKTFPTRFSKTDEEWFFLNDSLEEFFGRISDATDDE
ncbi:MAG: SMI1/KNR4 family protein [Planctomycetaceae bacterium]